MILHTGKEMNNIETSRFERFEDWWIRLDNKKGASIQATLCLNFLLLLVKLPVLLCRVALNKAHSTLQNSRQGKYHQSNILRWIMIPVCLLTDIVPAGGIILSIWWLNNPPQIGNETLDTLLTLVAVGCIIWAIYGIQVIVWSMKIIFGFAPPVKEENTVEDDVEDEEEQDTEYAPWIDEEVDAALASRQLFRVGKEMCLIINDIIMCPDETAIIRVVDDEGYTPPYKRKVRRDKKGNRFIVFNSTNYYLDDDKTQPSIQK